MLTLIFGIVLGMLIGLIFSVKFFAARLLLLQKIREVEKQFEIKIMDMAEDENTPLSKLNVKIAQFLFGFKVK